MTETSRAGTGGFHFCFSHAIDGIVVSHLMLIKALLSPMIMLTVLIALVQQYHLLDSSLLTASKPGIGQG
ncbi:hypothetical protein [Vogesella fluminis]|uniref:hypothetical protein n=1 Tax=Vogesella fluminis TaxID=1069161 RepID=UPI0016740FAD|nr:hypothetical protein [Vogesella fluminis]